MAYSGKVLVIDDNLDRASELADLASSAGFTTSVATSIDSNGSPLGEGSDFDVVLCDVHATPEAWSEDGVSLRELDVQVPVMMFSNESRSAGMMRALRLGANDFFPTPVEDTGALFASMERCVKLRSMSRELKRSREALEATTRELRDTEREQESDQQADRQLQMRML